MALRRALLRVPLGHFSAWPPKAKQKRRYRQDAVGRSLLEYAAEPRKGGAPRIAMRGDGLPECRRRYQREGCESGDPVVMQISSFCIDFGLGFGARYAKYAMYFKGRDEF
jgi:hypothetical protein